ncbi:MAG: conjugal transfer protein TraH [Candidatus Methylomirabilales bacterium]
MSLLRWYLRRQDRHRVSLVIPVLLVAFLTGFLAPTLAAAGGLDGGIDAFLHDWEGQMTGANPTFYEGQQRGYLFGGSLDLRFPNRNPAPIAITMPKIQAGCGGISLMGGAFSFINMQQFVQYLQAIAQNAMGMAFNMALTTLCPQCASVLAKLEEIARNVAGNLKSSCGMAKTLLASVGMSPDKLSGIAYENCTAINDSLGISDDVWGGAFKCKVPGAVKEADQRAISDWLANGANPFDPPLASSSNIFWSGYSRLAGNLPEYTTEFGEQLMSLFGTAVLNLASADQEGTPQNYAPKISVRELIDGWSNKRTWACDETTLCLNPNEVLAPDYGGLASTIEQELTAYATAVKTRSKVTLSPYLTSHVIGLPVARLITNTNAIPGATDMVISFASRYLAAQILQVYTRQLAQQVDAESRRVKDSGHLATFLDQFTHRRLEIEREFDEVQTDLSRGLRNLQSFMAIVNASQGSTSTMFSRHTAFSNTLLWNANPMGH